MTDKDRIEWFLALQQIVRIPRFPIAPTISALKKVAKPHKTDIHDTALSIFFQKKSIPQYVSSSLPIHSNRLIFGEKLQVPHPNMQIDQSIITNQNYSNNTYLKFFNNSQPLSKFNKQAKIFRINKHNYQTLVQHQEIVQKPLIKQLTNYINSQRKAFSPSKIKSTFVPELYNNTEIPEAVHPLKTNSLDDLPLRKDTRANSINQNYPLPKSLSNTLTVSGEENSMDSDKFSKNFHASTSILHLDGSVLGRWTIQHLERILSKPPLGMTGVDPRATTPRSRVSPF